MAASLSLYTISVFLPWAIEKGASSRVWMDPKRTHHVRRFRSFQAEIEVFRDDKLMDLLVLRFLEYWSPQTNGLYAYLYHGWVLVLVFQVLAVMSGVASVLKQKGRGKRLVLDCSTACFVLSLALCIFQLVRQWELQGGWYRSMVFCTNAYCLLTINFDIGFYLALIGVILWIIPPSYNRLHQASMHIWDRPLPSKQGIDYEEAWKKYPKALFNRYVRQYPHNPEGVLEWHIHKKMKEGKTREQAIEELAKESK